MQLVMLDLDIWLVAATIIKAITYGTTLSASGGVIFCFLFRNKISQNEEKSIRRYIKIAVWIAVLMSIVRIFVINIILSGELSGIFDLTLTRMVLESSEGIATGLRVASLLMIQSLCSNKLFYKFYGLTVFVGIVAAASFALVGHAGEVSMKNGYWFIPQGFLLLHLIAVAFWIGSLWPLRLLTESNDGFRVAKIMHHFGQVAVIFVSVLIVAGLFLIWLLLGRINLLWNSVYGQLLMVKFTAAFVLLTMAAINKLLITPKLLLINSKLKMEVLRKYINFEIALVCLILLITASFTTLVGPP
jgi:putative copper export protein